MIVLFANNAFSEQSEGLDDLYQETKRANQQRQANEFEQLDIQEQQLQIMRDMKSQQNQQELQRMYPDAYYKNPY